MFGTFRPNFLTPVFAPCSGVHGVLSEHQIEIQSKSASNVFSSCSCFPGPIKMMITLSVSASVSVFSRSIMLGILEQPVAHPCSIVLAVHSLIKQASWLFVSHQHTLARSLASQHVFFFRQQNSLFRQLWSLFRQVGSLFRQVGSLFRQLF